MGITDFLHNQPYTPLYRDAIIRDITGVTVSHIEGVVAMGEPLPPGADTMAALADPGYGVQVQSPNGEIWIYLVAVVEPGSDARQMKKEINTRLQAALWNLLYPDGTPLAASPPVRRVPYS